MSNFKENVRRMNERAEDRLYNRKTKRECTTGYHVGDRKDKPHAVMIVSVDNDCCRDPENETVHMCWQCAMSAFRDQFVCACGSENSTHKADDLTYKGEIQPVDA